MFLIQTAMSSKNINYYLYIIIFARVFTKILICIIGFRKLSRYHFSL